VNVNKRQISVLLDLKMKVNLVKKKILKKLNIFYSINCQLRLVNINNKKTILCNIIKSVSIQINSVCMIQSLFIVKKASQSMILNMSYVSATFIIIRAYFNNKINIEITSLQDDRWVQFQNFRQSLKMKYLSYFFLIQHLRREKIKKIHDWCCFSS